VINISIDQELYNRFSKWYISKKQIKGLDEGKLTPSDERMFRSFFFLLPRLLLIPLLFWFLKWYFIDFLLVKKGFEATLLYFLIYYLIIQEVIKIITSYIKEQN